MRQQSPPHPMHPLRFLFCPVQRQPTVQNSLENEPPLPNTFDTPSWAAQPLPCTWLVLVQPQPVQIGLTQLLLPQPVAPLQLSSSFVKTKAKTSFEYSNRKEIQVEDCTRLDTRKSKVSAIPPETSTHSLMKNSFSQNLTKQSNPNQHGLCLCLKNSSLIINFL